MKGSQRLYHVVIEYNLPTDDRRIPKRLWECDVHGANSPVAAGFAARGAWDTMQDGPPVPADEIHRIRAFVVSTGEEQPSGPTDT